MCNRRGQTILEYTLIVIIILGVMITMKNYIMRGFEGRWKSAADDFGDQYDPQFVNSNITYSTQGNSMSTVTAINGIWYSPDGAELGQWTNRSDLSNSVDTKTGLTQVGS